jgi:ribulose-bisphosphate carboxylase large chain
VLTVSSGNLIIPANIQPFLWQDDLDLSDFILATYRIRATCSGENAALGMAMEQSASTLSIRGYVNADMVKDWSIRIRSVKEVRDDVAQPVVAPFFLTTEVYAVVDRHHCRCYDIELAVPRWLLGNKPVQLLNVLVGELPRLGFLTSFRMTDLAFPAAFGPGPAFGRRGILQLLDMDTGPLLCRAMRPGVGLDTSTMRTLNRDVLVGGFHMVKDDELIQFHDIAAFELHLRAMLSARDEAMDATGERKLYIANLFCEPGELQERWDLACTLGVDGVLVAPFIQGLGILPWLARQQKMPVIAHNSFGDFLMRNRDWGIDETVLCRWVRHLGGDWFVTPGTFAAEGFDKAACRKLMEIAAGEDHGLGAMMPNIQGGKHPQGLPTYRDAVGDSDFTLIVANWVDSHADGLKAAAREFRKALESLTPTG